MTPTVFGLDISDRSIELAAVLVKKGTVAVSRVARIDVPPETVLRGEIVNPDMLARTLETLLAAVFGPKRGKLHAGVSLPEMQVYGKTFVFPANLNRETMAKAAAIEAADAFPVPAHQAANDFLLGVRGKEYQEAYYAVVKRDIVRAYADVLHRVGVQPAFFDGESAALARALVKRDTREHVLIADIGARQTNLIVCDGASVKMSSIVMIGGDALTAAIEKRMNIPLADAETMKRNAGFDPAADDGRVFLILQDPMNEIFLEIRKTAAYWERHAGRKIASVILAGGTSMLPGLVEFSASNLPGLPVILGDPRAGAPAFDGRVSDKAFLRAPTLYAPAFGLALRAAGIRRDPGLSFAPEAAATKKGIGTSIRTFFASLVPMATKSSKAPQRRRSLAKKAPAVPPEPKAPDSSSLNVAAMPPLPQGPAQPIRMQIDVEPSADAPTSAPVKPVAAVPAKPVATPSYAEEKDYGSGIGDILGGAAARPARSAVSTDIAETSSEDRRSIESILRRQSAGVPAASAPARYADDGGDDYPPAVSSRSRMPLLVALVVILFLVAIGGVAMFAKKTGMTLPFFSGKSAKPASTLPAPEPETPAEPESVSIAVRIAAAKDTEDAIVSRAVETDVKATGSFTATGETATASGRAEGTVTIVNNTNRPYTFVATTRVLSKEGVLFRLKNATAVPASGTVVADVVADQPGPEGDIAATTFTIPGLPSGTQKDVYARSDSAMTGGSGKAIAVTEEDIAKAKASLLADLRKEADDNFAALLLDGERLHPDLVTSKEIEVVAPKAGTPGEKFTVSVSLRFRALLLPEKEIRARLEAELKNADASDGELGEPLYAVEAYDTAAEVAVLRVEAPIIVR